MSNGNSTGNGGAVSNTGTLTVTNSTISENTSSGSGGGIYNESGMSVTITDSTFSGNSAGGSGGGIYAYANAALLTITNSTLSGNTAAGSGGGLYAFLANNVTLNNVTISGNGASSVGGLEVGGFTPLFIANTIIANSTSGTDCSTSSATVTASGGNLVEDSSCPSVSAFYGDPGLGDLANNGGTTQTHALLLGSSAIDAGVDAAIPPGVTTDQRGEARIQGARVDLGAYESAFTDPTITPTPTNTIVVTNTPTITPANLPDLVITLVRTSLPPGVTCFAPGVSLGIEVIFNNIGSTAAGNFRISLTNDTATFTQDVAGLGGGSQSSVFFATSLVSFNPVQVTLDSLGQVAESNEGNNTFTGILPVPTPPVACTATFTPTATATSTPTFTPTLTPSFTLTNTPTATFTNTPTSTNTAVIGAVCIVVSRTTISLNESSPLAVIYNVRLSAPPAVGEMVTITPLFDAAQIALSPLSRQLNLSNWNTGRNFTVTVIDDALAEANPHFTSLQHSGYSNIPGSAFNGITACQHTSVSIADNDSVTATETATASITPTATASITASATATATATATPTSTAMVTTQPQAGIHVQPTVLNLAEGGGSLNFTVRLAFPPADGERVTITAVIDGAQVSISPASRTFRITDWSNPRSITVTAVNDALIEGAHTSIITFNVTSDRPGSPFNFTPGNFVTVNIQDND